MQIPEGTEMRIIFFFFWLLFPWGLMPLQQQFLRVMENLKTFSPII